MSVVSLLRPVINLHWGGRERAGSFSSPAKVGGGRGGKREDGRRRRVGKVLQEEREDGKREVLEEES